jgi:hypothetical protein
MYLVASEGGKALRQNREAGPAADRVDQPRAEVIAQMGMDGSMPRACRWIAQKVHYTKPMTALYLIYSNALHGVLVRMPEDAVGDNLAGLVVTAKRIAQQAKGMCEAISERESKSSHSATRQFPRSSPTTRIGNGGSML